MFILNAVTFRIHKLTGKIPRIRIIGDKYCCRCEEFRRKSLGGEWGTYHADNFLCAAAGEDFCNGLGPETFILCYNTDDYVYHFVGELSQQVRSGHGRAPGAFLGGVKMCGNRPIHSNRNPWSPHSSGAMRDHYIKTILTLPQPTTKVLVHGR